MSVVSLSAFRLPCADRGTTHPDRPTTKETKIINIKVQKTNANPDGDPNGALDVWLRFESPEDEEASHEANTYRDEDGYVIKWYHSAVGLVTTVDFETLADAYDWYEREGFQDFTVAE